VPFGFSVFIATTFGTVQDNQTTSRKIAYKINQIANAVEAGNEVVI